jgi:hypothetical protein
LQINNSAAPTDIAELLTALEFIGSFKQGSGGSDGVSPEDLQAEVERAINAENNLQTSINEMNNELVTGFSDCIKKLNVGKQLFFDDVVEKLTVNQRLNDFFDLNMLYGKDYSGIWYGIRLVNMPADAAGEYSLILSVDFDGRNAQVILNFNSSNSSSCKTYLRVDTSNQFDAQTGEYSYVEWGEWIMLNPSVIDDTQLESLNTTLSSKRILDIPARQSIDYNQFVIVTMQTISDCYGYVEGETVTVGLSGVDVPCKVPKTTIYVQPDYTSPLIMSPSGSKVIRVGDRHFGAIYKTGNSTQIFFMVSSDGGGLSVTITHANGFQSGYAHLSEQLVKAGQKVKQGDTIAKSGNTGRSTGAHLHFTLRYNGIAIDPQQYLYK